MRTLIALLLCLASLPALAAPHACVGSKTCRVCKNCSSCKHCAKEGGTCGVKEKATPKEKPPVKKPKPKA